MRPLSPTILLGGLVALAPISIDMYLPAFPAVSADLATGASGIQLTLTTYLVGQVIGILLGGPASDAFGRRRPVLASLAAFSVVSVACALATSALALATFRFGQGLAGGVAVVIAPAFVRDLASGSAGARLMSWILGIGMIAPVVAPLIGSQLLLLGSWRLVFFVVAGFGVVWGLLCLAGLPETLDPAQRRRGLLGDLPSVLGRVARDPAFVGVTLAGGLSGAAFVVYLSSSSLVFQTVHGMSAQLYGLVFATNAVGFLCAIQANAQLLRRRSATQLLHAGLWLGAAASLVLLAVNLSSLTGVLGDAVPLFFLVASMGLVYPNATAIALTDYADAAGTASTIVRFVQTGLGAAAAPIVGLAGFSSSLPLALATAVLTTGGLAVALLTPRPSAVLAAGHQR